MQWPGWCEPFWHCAHILVFPSFYWEFVLSFESALVISQRGSKSAHCSSWKLRYLHFFFFFILLVLLCLFVSQKAELVSWEVVGSLVLMERKEQEHVVWSTETVPLGSLFGLIQPDGVCLIKCPLLDHIMRIVSQRAMLIELSLE